jgi:hypothetical protein
MSIAKEKEGTIYGWAFVAGQKIIQRFADLYGEEKADKRMENLLLTLRSELIADRFKRTLIDYLIEVRPEVGIPEEIKVERRWRVDEFYRYSTAILAGFLDAVNEWKTKRVEVKKGEEG